MKETCELNVIGQCTVPADWVGNVKSSINRLYYIHSGDGGYIKDGKRIEFIPNRLYLIPALSRIRTYAPPENRIYHTYADFELLPPIISRDVLSLDPHTDEDTEAATSVFMALCKTQKTLENPDMSKYLSDTVTYLAKKIAIANNSTMLNDPTIISALHIMHAGVKEKISVSKIAEMSHMSTEGLIRKFKSYIGETPYSYMKHLKVRMAMKLRSQGLGWEEIADACGYADTSTLLHAIKSRI